MPIQFGEFELDLESRQLRRAGEEIALSPKALALLELLVTRRPRALSRAQIRDHLWSATFVSESNLNTLVTQVRSALQDNPKAPAFIRTVHGFGYAFSGMATEVRTVEGKDSGQHRAYRLQWGTREIALGAGANVLGRVPEAVAWFENATVSRCHARIIVSDTGAVLEDLGSRNGTRLRGQKITAPMQLADGDEIQLGSVRMTFRIYSGMRSTEAEV